MSWATSTRRKRLPPDWARRVAATKQRAHGRCEAEDHDPRCDGVGAECDHHLRGDDHSLTNLRWLSHPCHQAKTNTEAADARRATQVRRARPAEVHPGVIPPRAYPGEVP